MITPRERALAAMAGHATDRPAVMPITMQFAARHAGVKYRQYATEWRAFVPAQVQVAEEFGFDYVNVMSDPAVEAADCGAHVHFPENATPIIDDNDPLVASPASLLTLKRPDPRTAPRMSNRLEMIRGLREQVGRELLVEGWIEGPMAEAVDLRGMSRIMLDFYDEPEFIHDFFRWITEMELEFAAAQVAAGADSIGIGDAAASLIGPSLYEEFVLPHEKAMVQGVHALGVPVRLHICGDTTALLPGIAELGIDMIDVDYPVSLERARAALGSRVAIAGNLDPVRAVRNVTADDVTTGLAGCLQAAAGGPVVLGAGCEIPPDTPEDNVRAFARFSLARSAA